MNTQPSRGRGRRRTLVVMAHYDASGEVAPHALRNMAAWEGVADRLLVVSTARLRDEARAAIEKRADLVQRANYGYDFYSWKVGLDDAGDLSGYDEVVICNDSYVGPLVPYADLLDAMRDRPVDFWGITRSRRRRPHVQSFFVAFRPWVVRSPAFRRFWRSMVPVSDRLEVITRYELGLSGALLDAGFRMGSYFTETPADQRLARLRHLWWAGHVVPNLPPHRRRRAARVIPFEPWNPMAALADRALDGARLPVVKIDTLRYDPYWLGAGRLLDELERAYPDALAGVRDYLDRTRAAYPPRAHESPGPVVLGPGLRHLLGY